MPSSVLEKSIAAPEVSCKNSNTILDGDETVHNWYRFVLSFPPHLVRKYLEAFDIRQGHAVLDPFCGTGTTLVECRKRGIASVGVEAHPLAALASRVKTRWDLSPRELRKTLQTILRRAGTRMSKARLDSLSFTSALVRENSPRSSELTEEETRLIPEGFLSQKPQRRLLILREAVNWLTRDADSPVGDFFRLALCHVIANGAGNFAFGPEIYRTKAKDDYDVMEHFSLHASQMIHDLESLQTAHASFAPCKVLEGDARSLDGLEANCCQAVITSPPYPNEKDYTRITRVESVLLGLISDRKQLRHVKQSLLRSNTRNVFVQDSDGEWVAHNPRVQSICQEIERRREKLGKTSGFERLYHRVVAHYFGGMARHFAVLRAKLAARARCAYVVGDQLSFLLVPIPTASLLSGIAEEQGFRVIGCDLWRTRFGTKSGTRVREEILILEKC